MTSPQMGREGSQKYWNLLSKKTTNLEVGVIKLEKWADVVYGWPQNPNVENRLFEY